MLKKYLCLLLLGFAVSLSPVNAYADDDDGFDFMEDDVLDDGANDDFAFADGGDDGNDALLSSTPVSLNDGSGLANVANFDIAGIMLGMSFEDVYNLYHNIGNLYAPRKKNSLVYDIPQDWQYNLDYECRQSGVMQPNKVKKCIRGLARRRGLLYVSEIHLERVKTGETIDVYLTSNATDNIVYRIVYTNDADKVEGNAEQFSDQREKKILSFWKMVVKKYGAPNSGNDTWITSTNAYDPKMTAYYGSLDLIDEGKRAMDVANSAQHARDNFRAKPYSF